MAIRILGDREEMNRFIQALCIMMVVTGCASTYARTATSVKQEHCLKICATVDARARSASAATDIKTTIPDVECEEGP